MSATTPAQGSIDPITHNEQHEMDAPNFIEKTPSAPQPEASSTEKEDDVKLAHFHELSPFDKLWVSTQVSAFVCSLAIILGGGGMYFTTDLVNCDGHSPYSQALVSGLYAMVLGMYAWLSAWMLRRTDQKLNVQNSLSLAARQRRRQRIPIFLAFAASGQYVAALIHGLVAYRTSRAPLGWNPVYIVATIGTMMCLAAGTSDICFAASRYRSQWSDVRTELSEKKDDEDTSTTAEESTLLYDTDFTRLPAFDKQWLAVHVFALVSLFSMSATSSSLLWQIPCGDSARKPLRALSQNSFTPWCQVVTLGTPLMQIWLPRINKPAEKTKLPRFMIIMAQCYLALVGVTLCLEGYAAKGNSQGLWLVKVQSAITGSVSNYY